MVYITPTAEAISAAFKRDFAAADQNITWTAAETYHMRWLSPTLVIHGTVDAEGINAEAKPFFADWKTISPFKAGNMEQVKAEWRMDPQALTYGLLLGDKVRDFTVRWAIKKNPVLTDFEWYTYTKAELDWWELELHRHAKDLLRARKSGQGNWRANLTNCTRYGWNHRCPLYDNGCSKLNFNHDPDLPPRTHNVEAEQKILSEFKGDPRDLVVWSSSSLEKWLGCQEQYRRFYEGDGLEESGPALQLGSDFHALQASYIRGMID